MFCGSSLRCHGDGLQCVIVVFPDHTHILLDHVSNVQCFNPPNTSNDNYNLIGCLLDIFARDTNSVSVFDYTMN